MQFAHILIMANHIVCFLSNTNCKQLHIINSDMRLEADEATPVGVGGQEDGPLGLARQVLVDVLAGGRAASHADGRGYGQMRRPRGSETKSTDRRLLDARGD